ncbi:MAG TPA: hypothetical protein VKA68_06350 [bacterium]|nr:hypothetical protein [bacterium]
MMSNRETIYEQLVIQVRNSAPVIRRALKWHRQIVTSLWHNLWRPLNDFYPKLLYPLLSVEPIPDMAGEAAPDAWSPASVQLSPEKATPRESGARVIADDRIALGTVPREANRMKAKPGDPVSSLRTGSPESSPERGRNIPAGRTPLVSDFGKVAAPISAPAHLDLSLSYLKMQAAGLLKMADVSQSTADDLPEAIRRQPAQSPDEQAPIDLSQGETVSILRRTQRSAVAFRPEKPISDLSVTPSGSIFRPDQITPDYQELSGSGFNRPVSPGTNSAHKPAAGASGQTQTSKGSQPEITRVNPAGNQAMQAASRIQVSDFPAINMTAYHNISKTLAVAANQRDQLRAMPDLRLRKSAIIHQQGSHPATRSHGKNKRRNNPETARTPSGNSLRWEEEKIRREDDYRQSVHNTFNVTIGSHEFTEKTKHRESLKSELYHLLREEARRMGVEI